MLFGQGESERKVIKKNYKLFLDFNKWNKQA